MLNATFKTKWPNWESIAAFLSLPLTLVPPCGVAIIFAGCVSYLPNSADNLQTGESVVLVGEEPANLAFTPLQSQPVHVRNTYRDGLPQTIHYEPGRDYALDASGRIRRTLGSRIPDFRNNVIYGKKNFNHFLLPIIDNRPFFVYVDYSHHEKWSPAQPPVELSAIRLPNTLKKLSSGKTIRIVAYGDSITGGEATSAPSLIFWNRWADMLRQKYPRATIETINSGTGGDTTDEGLQRLSEKVFAHKPDLVLIGFGMNDHNREFGVPLDAFADNLRTMIDRVRANNGAEIVLLSTFPPNPKWHFSSHNMVAYAAATEQVAREKHCAFADVYHVFMQFAEKKKPEDLFANNINHPNDFGHWIYFQALVAMNLPK